jgi:hypothetical protein
VTAKLLLSARDLQIGPALALVIVPPLSATSLSQSVYGRRRAEMFAHIMYFLYISYVI